MCGAIEILILTDRDIESQQPQSGTQVDFLVRVIEIAGVVVAGKANAKCRLTNIEAVAEVTIDLKSIADIGNPGARIKAA